MTASTKPTYTVRGEGVATEGATTVRVTLSSADALTWMDARPTKCWRAEIVQTDSAGQEKTAHSNDHFPFKDQALDDLDRAMGVQAAFEPDYDPVFDYDLARSAVKSAERAASRAMAELDNCVPCIRALDAEKQ